MDDILFVKPYIRGAHHYIFPADSRHSESCRIGYCYALHYVEGGRGLFSINQRTHVIKKGDLLFIPPACEHAFEGDPLHSLRTYNIYGELWTDSPVATNTCIVWDAACFNPAWLTEIRGCGSLDRIPSVLPINHQSELIGWIASIVNQHQQQDAYSGEIARQLLKAVVLSLVRISGNIQPADPRIVKIMERIDREAETGSDYDIWLLQSGLKKTQFHHLFKQASGLSPKAYWTKTIMKKAAAALLESNESITELAERFGYASIHHFSKQFTAYYGVSPTGYRNQRRNHE